MKRSILSIVTITILLVSMFASVASATGPRVTKSLFAIEANEIHALDFPPFLSTEVADGGPLSEIVHIALKQAEIDAVISTHPVQRMVKYYLMQEQALAVTGRHLNFSREARKDLIFIPLSVLSENFYYYKPAFPAGLRWNGKLALLKGKTYGAHKGENVSAFKAAGISVKEGRTITLLKMIASGEVDFAALPEPTLNWLVNKYMAGEKDHFAAMVTPAGKDVMYVVFNRKHPLGEASAAKFRSALATMVDDGSYAAIIQKHLGNGELLERYMDDLKEQLSKK